MPAHPFFVRITITGLPDNSCRWVLETGPNDILMESGRAPDIVTCARQAQDAQAELGLSLALNADIQTDPTSNVLTHPRFQR